MKRKFIKIVVLVCLIIFPSILCGHVIVVQFRGCAPGTGMDYTSDPNLQFYGRMNCSGNELDRSGNGNTLSEVGEIIPTSSDVASGWTGTSRDFEKDDTEYLERADVDLVGLDISGADAKLSIVTKINVESVVSNEQYPIIAKYGDLGNLQYKLYIIGDGAANFIIFATISSNGNGETGVFSPTSLSIGTWYSIGLVLNDVDLRMYVNGLLDCTPIAHTSGIYNGNAAFRIGTSSETGAKYGDVLVDDTGIFDRELSAAEVLEIHNYGVDGSRGGND